MRNPVLTERAFQSVGVVDESSVMTLRGAAWKSVFLVVVTMAVASVTWGMAFRVRPGSLLTMVNVSLVVAFVMALVITFKQSWSPVLAPVYAILEGAALGVISAAFDMEYSGIALHAVLITGGVLLSLLFLYLARIVQATENFKAGVISATIGVAAIYLIDLVLRFFGASIPLLTDNGILGIGLSFVIAAIAALNLVLDFDFIERGAQNGLPKYFEWYAGFGLLVSLIWLYLEILRLLAKFASSRK